MKRRQVGTKGILNHICEKYGVNQKRKTVAIQDLIRYHKPKQQAELIALIASHAEGGQHRNCDCGCKSAGTINDFADNLFAAYVRFTEECDANAESKDWTDCYIFMKHLFVVGSLRGNDMENKMVRVVNLFLNTYYNIHSELYVAKLATATHDFNYSVDISLFDTTTGDEMFGVQVKPLTYKNFKSSHHVVKQNLRKNEAYGKDVVYIYYDKNNNIVDAAEVSNSLADSLQKYLDNK